MTCSGFFVDGKEVWAYSDGVAWDGYMHQHIKDPKFFQVGELWIAYTSSFRMADILQYNLNLPERKNNISDVVYIKKYVIEEIRATLINHAFAEKSNNVESGGQFCICYKGVVYSVDDDFQCVVLDKNFFSVGSGSIAMSAAFMAISEKDVKKKLLMALDITAKVKPTVSKPFFVKKIT